MSNWVHIDKKRPSSNTMILMYAPLNDHTANGITYGFYDAYKSKWLHHGSCLDGNYEEVSDQRHRPSQQMNTAVSHWMPLPAPPEAVTE